MFIINDEKYFTIQYGKYYITLTTNGTRLVFTTEITENCFFHITNYDYMRSKLELIRRGSKIDMIDDITIIYTFDNVIFTKYNKKSTFEIVK